MADGQLYGFVPNVRGIDRALSSPAVKSQLKSYVDGVASSANANFGLHAGDLVPLTVQNGTVQNVKFNGAPRIEPYGSYVDQGAYVPIGKVVCKTALGRYDNATNNTILKSR